MEAPIQDILEQFLHLVRQTNKRTELLNWVTPYLQRYLTAADEVKTWIAHAEGKKSVYLIRDVCQQYLAVAVCSCF